MTMIPKIDYRGVAIMSHPYLLCFVNEIFIIEVIKQKEGKICLH